MLFLAIGTLYLNIRPETTGTATTGTSDVVPAQVTDQAPAPTTTTPEPTEEQPTPTVETTVPGAPTDGTTPRGDDRRDPRDAHGHDPRTHAAERPHVPGGLTSLVSERHRLGGRG